MGRREVTTIAEALKQTPVGPVPEDWTVATIGEIASTSSGTTPSRALFDRYYANGSINWAKTLDLHGADIEDTDERVTPIAFEETSLRLYPAGTVLVAMYGGFNQIGRTGLLRQPAAVNQAISAIQVSPTKLCPDYLLAVLNLSVHHWKSVASSSRKDPNITSADVRGFPIAIPPLNEQHAIAAALRDIASLTRSLDDLIAKKRDFKQAAMQQLLTGRTRLPGFTGSWRQTTLREIGDCIIGLTYDPADVENHGLLVLRSSNIQGGRLHYEDNVYVRTEVPDHLYTRCGDILVCVRNGSRALIGKCVAIDHAAAGHTFGAFMAVFRTKHWRYVVHAFQGPEIQRQIQDNIGATINQITNKDMKAFRVNLPPDDEAAAIAGVLSDIDDEVAALESRRTRTLALKQGMMQQLLTGRIRLI